MTMLSVKNKQVANNNKPLHTIKKSSLKSAISLALAVGSLSLLGCQSTAQLPSQTQLYAQNNHSLSPIKPQLLNEKTQPSASATAQKHLLSAVNQHFAKEHQSISQTNYAMRPFVTGDSVDAGSQSLFMTVLETIDYGFKQKEEEEQEDEKTREWLIEEYATSIREEMEQAIAEGKEVEVLSEEEIIAQAEEEVAESWDSEELEEPEDLKSSSKSSLRNYMMMKAEQMEASAEQNADLSDNDSSIDTVDTVTSIKSISDLTNKGTLMSIIGMLYRSPEQVQAMQHYSAQYMSYNSLGHFLPEQHKYQGVASYDFNSPTIQFSAQLPYGVDFDNQSLTIDPSVVAPLMVLFSSNDPLMDNPEALTMKFRLPEEIGQQIPSTVIFEAFIKGLSVGLKEMDSELFTLVDISEDDYAKQVGAKRAVKVYWGSKQMGDYLGKLLKSMSQDIQTHIEQHPEQYENRAALVEMMKKWSMLESDFQSKDVGGLLQIIEAIAPINFNQTTYYYLDSTDKLLAHQGKVSIGSELYGWTMDSVVQTSYQASNISKSPLYALYQEDFGNNAPASIDGNQWLAKMRQQRDWEREARNVREYEYPDTKSTQDAASAATEAAMDVAVAVAATDYDAESLELVYSDAAEEVVEMVELETEKAIESAEVEGLAEFEKMQRAYQRLEKGQPMNRHQQKEQSSNFVDLPIDLPAEIENSIPYEQQF